jgi:uncharacterized protein
MFITQLYAKIRSFIETERSPQKLAFSVSLSIFIAFSPFIGFHTIMAFFFSWIFALNVALLLTISMLINNPWTMFPIYATDHAVGDGIFYLLGIDAMHLNPSWTSVCNAWIAKHIGISGISFWAFIIGGNSLGLLMSLFVYPIVRHIAIQRAQSI